MAKGRVKWVNQKKGFGSFPETMGMMSSFTSPAIKRDGFKSLYEGDEERSRLPKVDGPRAQTLW